MIDDHVSPRSVERMTFSVYWFGEGCLAEPLDDAKASTSVPSGSTETTLPIVARLAFDDRRFRGVDQVVPPSRFADAIEERKLPGLFARAPDTVGIEFRGRVFIWHAFPSAEHRGPGHEEWGPTVTVLIKDEAAAEDVANDLQRFVSALAFNYQEPPETRYEGVLGFVDAAAGGMGAKEDASRRIRRSRRIAICLNP
jgi:hypothetical protein